MSTAELREMAERYAAWAYALTVAGAAMVYPPAALLVAGAYFALLAFQAHKVADEQPAPPETTE